MKHVSYKKMATAAVTPNTPSLMESSLSLFCILFKLNLKRNFECCFNDFNMLMFFFVSVMSELTLVLIGDDNAIEIGSNNILLDHDMQTNGEQFSSRLYDLCGQHIFIINMLGH